MPVPAPALAASGDDDLLVRGVEIGQQDVVIGVVDQRAGRDGDEQVFAALAVHFLAHAALALAGRSSGAGRRSRAACFCWDRRRR